MVSVDVYNLTNFTNSEGNPMVNFIRFTSEGTNYLPGILVLLMIYFVIFLALKLKGASTMAAFVACNFLNFVVALMLYPLNAIGGNVLVISIVLLPLSVLLMWILGTS